MTNYLKANFLRRSSSYLIDTIIVYLFYKLIILITPNLDKFIEILVLLIINIFYSVLMIYFFGYTFGKKILRIKVVSYNYQKLTLMQSFVRESFGKFLSSIFYVGYLNYFLDNQRRTWHDKIAKTYVIQLDKNNNLIPINYSEMINKNDKFIFYSLLILLNFHFFIFIFLLFYLFVVLYPVQIKGGAMAPNYLNNQNYLVAKLGYLYKEPNRGDVIIYRLGNKQYIRRIVGLPNEIILINQGKIYINKKNLKEDYLDKFIYTEGGDFLFENISYKIPENHYFVLSDNRIYKNDSRAHGPIAKEKIIGKVFLCILNCN